MAFIKAKYRKRCDWCLRLFDREQVHDFVYRGRKQRVCPACEPQLLVWLSAGAVPRGMRDAP